MNKAFSKLFFLLLLLTPFIQLSAQQITGVWKGKMNNQRVELKIIQKGDSLVGTSYYPSLTGGTRRYSIKGYFDANTNSVIWWDEELISSKGDNASGNHLYAVSDFNCPGGGRIYLDGKSSKKEDPTNTTGEVSLTKVPNATFRDEWDFVLTNYSIGGNHPSIIDSVGKIATAKKTAPTPPTPIPPIAKATVPKTEPVIKKQVPAATPKPSTPAVPPVAKAGPSPVIEKKIEPIKKLTIDEMFVTRKKVFAQEIPIEGDSIRLHFYDNAEVDGDSITLYLNNKILFTNIRLTANPYIVTLALTDLAEENELVMVAENLGSIPPNTAYMMAMVAGIRYEAFLESTEGSSSLIRFTKAKKE